MDMPAEARASMERPTSRLGFAAEAPTFCAIQDVSLELTKLVIEPPGPRRLLHSAAYEGLPRFSRRVLEVSAEVALTWVTDVAMSHQLADSQILWSEVGAAPPTTAGRRIALYAHYSASGRISSMVCRQLASYRAHGFDVVFVTNSQNVEENSWRAAAAHCWYLVRRRNIGFDFGAWRDAAALLLAGQLPEELLLVNDSVLGPLRSLTPLFAFARMMGGGAIGLTESRQGGVHLQSYFIFVSGAAVMADTLEFLFKMRLSTGKWLLVQRGEFGLTRFLVRRGHRVAALFGYARTLDTILACSEERRYLASILPKFAREIEAGVNPHRLLLRWPLNPSIHLWRGLVRKMCFPFIKTALFRRPFALPGFVDWSVLTNGEGVEFAHLVSDHLETLGVELRAARGRHQLNSGLSCSGCDPWHRD
jgi:hypothetical protein